MWIVGITLGLHAYSGAPSWMVVASYDGGTRQSEAEPNANQLELADVAVHEGSDWLIDCNHQADMRP